jgi:uncharacterized protein YndB with AHSA1/START domain
LAEDDMMNDVLTGRRQLTRSRTVRANTAAVWQVLADSRLLPRWAPVVHEVEACSSTGESVGATRRCNVELGGRQGRMVERCVDVELERTLAYVVDDETFGMRRMFADYGFRISIEPSSPDETLVTIQTFYTPRNPFYALLNALFMRRQFRGVVDALLAGLVSFAEDRSLGAKDSRPSAAAEGRA